MDKHTPCPVASLGSEKPVTLMAQLRAVWPDVEKALKVGHTLRVIHERLNQGGIPISYRRLTVYRGRIQRGKRLTGRSVHDSPVVTKPETREGHHPSAAVQAAFDPTANLRRQEEKERSAWRYPTGPPDESKLF